MVARYHYGNNIPFIAAESKYFKSLMNQLRPSYTPPNRKRLAGDLLDTVYKEVTDEIIEKLAYTETITISQDGWSNTQNDPIIAHRYQLNIFQIKFNL